uniref:Uncharacterized protein n=1 Tax=Amphimedon queenslandica TaxID=400682 RepID=A0A1X7SP33_AMPQE
PLSLSSLSSSLIEQYSLMQCDWYIPNASSICLKQCLTIFKPPLQSLLIKCFLATSISLLCILSTAAASFSREYSNNILGLIVCFITKH